VGLLNGTIKRKGTEESQKFAPLSRRQKKNSLGLHGFEHFFPFDWSGGFFPLVVLCRVLSRYYYYYYYYFTTTTVCLCSIILSPLNRFRRS
jgi:dolichyl-phosphate-mannose--protein O-mannosyl transferase